MTGIAIGYDRRELAIVALAGGLVAPFLTASGEGNHIVLFSYLTILHTGMFALSLYKKWWELPVISFAATYLIMGLFVPRCFTYEASPMLPRHMLGFSTLFYLLFASAIVAVFRTRNNRFQIVLLGVITLNNFLYLLFGLTFLSGLGHNFSEGGVIPLFIAAVNAGLLWYVRRRKEQMPVLRDLLLGLTILFITLVAWCQFKEYTNTLTACWAAEAVLLTWLYLRSRIPVYEYAAAALCALTFLASAAILSAEPDGGVRIFPEQRMPDSALLGCRTHLGSLDHRPQARCFTGAKALNFPGGERPAADRRFPADLLGSRAGYRRAPFGGPVYGGVAALYRNIARQVPCNCSVSASPSPAAPPFISRGCASPYSSSSPSRPPSTTRRSRSHSPGYRPPR